MIRYNPFKKQIDELDNDSEHFFDQDANVVLGNLQEAGQESLRHPGQDECPSQMNPIDHA